MGVEYINPDGLNKNPAFSNVIAVSGNAKTVYVGGQDAVDASGQIVGKGDLKAQVEQVLKNLEIALEAGGRNWNTSSSGICTSCKGSRCKRATARFRG